MHPLQISWCPGIRDEIQVWSRSMRMRSLKVGVSARFSSGQAMIQLDPKLDVALDRIKTKLHVNINAWIRCLMRAALNDDPQYGPGVTAVQPPRLAAVPPPPIPDWNPRKLMDNS